MSAVHKEIALSALASLGPEEASVFSKFETELAKASEYPDIFANTAMSKEAKDRIDLDADKLIYPEAPDAGLAKRIENLTGSQALLGAVPLRMEYLAGHYLRKALEAFDNGSGALGTKLCAVYSHVIGDIGEPIHAIHPSIVDAVLPPPPKLQGLELHSCIEGLKAPPKLNGYKPQSLGAAPELAEMNAYAALERCKELGASLAVPIAKALYEGRKAEARKLSAIAQTASAAAFADFLHTVARLVLKRRDAEAPRTLDLRLYPAASAQMDMLYRYRVSIDRSLIPYSGGKSKPLTIATGKGKAQRVKGIGMIGSLAPPFSKDSVRKGSVEYFLVPGAFRRFSARAGLNPLFRDSLVPAVFRVYADGKLAAATEPLALDDEAIEIEAGIAGARWLKLEMEYAANPSSEDVARLHCAWASHGVWAWPQLS